MKLLGIVVTYYPDIEDAKLNISRYIDYVDKLIIWENTLAKDRNLYKLKLNGYEDKIIYQGTNNNEGIGYALNKGIEWGINNGYTHILTMDQDSYFQNFALYKEIVCKYILDSKIGVFSPNVNFQYSEEMEIIDVERSITSGSIYSLSMFQNTGLFREDYFIDAVDSEFSIRARMLGFKTVAIGKSILDQQFGKITKSKLGFSSTNYSAFRTFYIIRNHIWLWREYPDSVTYELKRYLILESIIKRIPKILIYESNKISKLKSILKGTYHGIKKQIR